MERIISVWEYSLAWFEAHVMPHAERGLWGIVLSLLFLGALLCWRVKTNKRTGLLMGLLLLIWFASLVFIIFYTKLSSRPVGLFLGVQ